jgi:hypothetical protein
MVKLVNQRASALFFIGSREGEQMAKDGTSRGGARVGAGRRPKALADKMMYGLFFFSPCHSKRPPMINCIIEGLEITLLQTFYHSLNLTTGNKYPAPIFASQKTINY